MKGMTTSHVRLLLSSPHLPVAGMAGDGLQKVTFSYLRPLSSSPHVSTSDDDGLQHDSSDSSRLTARSLFGVLTECVWSALALQRSASFEYPAVPLFYYHAFTNARRVLANPSLQIFVSPPRPVNSRKLCQRDEVEITRVELRLRMDGGDFSLFHVGGDAARWRYKYKAVRERGSGARFTFRSLRRISACIITEQSCVSCLRIHLHERLGNDSGTP